MSVRRSERDPDAVAPVATAFVVVVPAVVAVVVPVVMPVPVIRMPLHVHVRIMLVTIRVPAIAAVVASDVSACASSGECQRTHSQQRRHGSGLQSLTHRIFSE